MLLQVYGNENHVEREDVNVLVPPLDRALVPGGHEVTNVYECLSIALISGGLVIITNVYQNY